MNLIETRRPFAPREIDINFLVVPYLWSKRIHLMIFAALMALPFTLLSSADLVINRYVSWSLEVLWIILSLAAWGGWSYGTVVNTVNRLWFLISPLVLAFIAIAGFILWWEIHTDHPTAVGSSWLMAAITLAAIATLGVLASLAVFWLRKQEVIGIRLTTLLRSPSAPASRPGKGLVSRNPRIGLSLIGVGVFWLLIASFLPKSLGTESFVDAMNSPIYPSLLLMLGTALLQPTANAILAVDKRAPVLLLRSFSDHENGAAIRAEVVGADDPLETKIAKYFNSIGPFITVDSPHDGELAIGAARARLSDAEWQHSVTEWIEASSVILMMIGNTPWIEWELGQVVTQRAVQKLIVCFPQGKRKRFSRQKRYKSRKAGAEARLESLQAAFRETVWEAELSNVKDPTLLRTIVFGPNGRVSVVVARSRNRNISHLAILISHYLQVVEKHANDFIGGEVR